VLSAIETVEELEETHTQPQAFSADSKSK
jgi:hypothetical protein